MGRVIIEVPDVTTIEIKSKDIIEAINRLINLKKLSKKGKNKKPIQRFKGIAKFRIQFNDVEWYLQ